MNEVLQERNGAALVLTLNRPEKANAMNEAMHDALLAGLAAAAGDDSVTAVVLAAAGDKVFSAGADLKEFAELERGLGARRRRVLLMHTLNAVLDFPKPLVAAVQGKALGAGCMVAMLADELVMADTAQLGLPEIKHGIPTPVGYVIVAARAGMPIARRMVQGGESIESKDCLALGLADEIAGNVREKSLERAKALAKHSGPSFAANKKFMNASLRAAMHAAFAEADRL